MANPLVLKASLGLGGIAVVTGASIGIPKLLSEKEQLVSDLLKTKNPEKRLITSNSLEDAEWKRVWASYRNDNKSSSKNSDTFKLPDWNGPISTEITSSDNATQSFLNACSSNSTKKTLPDSQLYKDVLKYCTRDTLISDLVKDSGKTALSKTDNQANSEEWMKAWKSYVKDNPNDVGDAWSINSYTTEKAKSESSFVVSEDFRNKCESKLKSTSITDMKLLDQVKSWCTVEGK